VSDLLPTNQPPVPEVLRGPDLPLAVLKRFWVLGLFALLLAGTAFIWFLGAFYDQGYAPEQPINYSHKLHAGDMHLDCLYCHFNADKGKHAGVPPMSVCMGCHAQVATNRPEIKKLTDIADKGTYTDESGVVHEGGMVHWNRVHKLPDHVFFSHQWHVKGGVACQTCHGPVEEMPVVRQYATLTMGWCLDCHRKSNYVGGPAFRKDDPASFTVGTANYDVVRHPLRTPADREVVFAEREVAGKPAQAKAAEAAHGEARPVGPTPRASTSEAFLRQLKANPALPRWRVADLPATHVEAYRDLFEKDDQGEPVLDLSKTLMNAPTQCNTCHQ
jgi:hypothetical protein